MPHDVMPLPVCRHRRPAAEEDLLHCDSPILRLDVPVPHAVCAGCSYPDLTDHPADSDFDRARCLYRGPLLRAEATKARPASPPINPNGANADGNSNGAGVGAGVDVYLCGVHHECTIARWREGVACCAVCEHYRPRDTSPEAADEPANSVAAMMEALRGPRREWPEHWPWWGTTIEAHRRLAREYVASLPGYPAGKHQGRGIVILGGGVFFPGVYVAVRMIRHFGCELPIEVWHDAATEPLYPHWLEPYGVRVIDIGAHMDAHGPPRVRGGWANKFYAILHSSFEEVLYLDSDCYPVVDVTPLFDANVHGATFFENPDPGKWYHPHVFGGAAGTPGLVGGHFVLHKRLAWAGLLLAQWWNERADFSYRHALGDQDVLRGAWQALELPASISPCRYHPSGLIVYGADGMPLFAHRFLDKFRLPGFNSADSSAAEAFLHHHMWLDTAPTFRPDYPGDELAFGYFREFLAKLQTTTAWHRPGSADDFVLKEVLRCNGYRLPDRLPAGARVVDVGAHVGAFAQAVLCRGAARVWCYEVDPENVELCRKNLSLFGRRVILRHQAVWPNARRVRYVPYAGNNAAGLVQPDGNDLDAVSLDDVLLEATDGGRHPVEYLKLDCEYAEWPILYHARRLDLCRNIVGEYHCTTWDGSYCGPSELGELLAYNGFRVEIVPYSPGQGLFWARRA